MKYHSIVFFYFVDSVTLLGEKGCDEFFRQSSDSTIFHYIDNYTKQQKRASFLYDSTHTLCSEDHFSPYPENDNDDDQENQQIPGFTLRSNSLNVLQYDEKSPLVEKPKKIVRFADMLVSN